MRQRDNGFKLGQPYDYGAKSTTFSSTNTVCYISTDEINQEEINHDTLKSLVKSLQDLHLHGRPSNLFQQLCLMLAFY